MPPGSRRKERGPRKCGGTVTGGGRGAGCGSIPETAEEEWGGVPAGRGGSGKDGRGKTQD